MLASGDSVRTVVFNSTLFSNRYKLLPGILEALGPGRKWCVVGAAAELFHPETGIPEYRDALGPLMDLQTTDRSAAHVLLVDHAELGTKAAIKKYLRKATGRHHRRPLGVTHVLCLQSSAFFRIRSAMYRPSGRKGCCSASAEPISVSDHSTASGIQQLVALLRELGFQGESIFALQRELQDEFEEKYLGGKVERGGEGAPSQQKITEFLLSEE